VSGATFAGICELVLEAEDPETVAEFYLELGLTELDRDHDRIWLAAGPGSRLGIWTPGEKEHGDRGGRHVHFALSVDGETLDRLAQELNGGGQGFEGPVEHDGGDRSIYLDDPAGNRVELWNFFEDADGARAGVGALNGGDDG
jgi:catechol-2,3-dioxygenase